MAKVIQDPAKHPEAIVGDFSTPNPLVTFRKEDIAFTYGSKWKQRYFTKRGDDYYVFPAQWDVRAKTWRRYYVEPGTDWWADHYPRRSDAAADGPAVRRLSLGQLRHQDQDGHRVERRLREVPRTPAAFTSSSPSRRRSSIRRSSTPCAPTTCASSATRRASRGPSRSTASTTTGRSAISPAID